MWRFDANEETLVVGSPTFTFDPGCAYVFRRDGSAWADRGKLTPSEQAEVGCFGFQVALGEDRVLVSAPFSTDRKGAAFVFRWDGSSWNEEQKLTASDGEADAFFGGGVDIEGDVVVVGAETAGERGAAYVFRRDGSSWNEEQRLTPSDGSSGDEFGHAVAVQGDEVVIGAPFEDAQGAAYVYRASDGVWTKRQKLTAPDRVAGDEFARHVAYTLNGDNLIVGTTHPQDGLGGSASAYIFERADDSWASVGKLIPSGQQLRMERGLSSVPGS